MEPAIKKPSKANANGDTINCHVGFMNDPRFCNVDDIFAFLTLANCNNGPDTTGAKILWRVFSNKA